jgi:hypothetical protein
MKKYTFWFKATINAQLIAAGIHAISLFITLPTGNQTEKQLASLMDNYKFDLGAGFHRTMSEMTLVFSACFCLLCLFGGLLNGYLLRKKVEPGIIKGVININLIIFCILLGLVMTNAFLLPILLIGMIVLFLILTRLSIHS